MKLYSIETGNFKLDGGAMFGVVPKSIWQKHYPVNEENLCNFSMRSLLVVDGNRRILIDNGLGDKQDEKFFANFHLNGDDTLIKSLANAGFKPEDITDNVMTHLHFDHVGGGIKYNEDRTAFELTFPNATYWVGKEQWNWAINPNKREKASYLKENLLPMQDSGHLKFMKKEVELFPNFFLHFFNGHTQGQVIPFINFNGKTMVYVGDLIPSSANLPIAYIASYDIQPLIQLEEKEKFLNEACEKNYTLFFEHDLYVECCTLKKTERGIRMDKAFKLSEFTGQ